MTAKYAATLFAATHISNDRQATSSLSAASHISNDRKYAAALFAAVHVSNDRQVCSYPVCSSSHQEQQVSMQLPCLQHVSLVCLNTEWYNF